MNRSSKIVEALRGNPNNVDPLDLLYAGTHPFIIY